MTVPLAERLNAKKAAEYLGIPRRSIYAMIKEGRIPAIEENGEIAIEQGVLDAFLAACRVESYERFQSLPIAEKNHRHWIARLGENKKHERLLSDKKVRANKSAFPYTGPAIYFLYEGEEIVYVGQAVNVILRIAAHMGRKQFEQFSWIPCKKEELNELERRAIIKYKPKLNRQ